MPGGIGAQAKNPLIGYGMIVIYALAIPTVGFFVSTAAYMVLATIHLGYRKWIVVICVTLGLE